MNDRHATCELTDNEPDIRSEILAGLITESGEAQISTATRILAEIISRDVALLVTFNQAIENVIKNNQKARQIPKRWHNRTATAGRVVVGESPTVRHRKVAKVKILQEIIDEMGDNTSSGEST